MIKTQAAPMTYWCTSRASANMVSWRQFAWSARDSAGLSTHCLCGSPTSSSMALSAKVSFKLHSESSKARAKELKAPKYCNWLIFRSTASAFSRISGKMHTS
eukprot:CAMPEP_0170422146 /NCGR_PEP_ID=MMETSP0117_2-20130122/36283_1 /TAXON_ID=400756 /ORGANISM="Durinskia baltica, Strain CSIRO CS-38" /LENGTH=101 /DNA_ID=CAMNT_0010680757 /DNA_START=158 /DNA_END=463 /DNA_ORIENTATION=+